MLTARTATGDKIEGLEAGADDYLTKPFHPRELLARIRAVWRRTAATTTASPEKVDVGDVRLSAARRQVWCRGEEVALTTVEFDILELLMRRAGQAVSRDDLTAAFVSAQRLPTSGASTST